MTKQRINGKYIELFTDSKETAKQVQEEFSAFEPGYQNNIRYRSGQWDGKHRFYSVKSGQEGWLFKIPIGFKGRVQDLTKEKFKENLDYSKPMAFLKETLPQLPFKPYDHQLKMFLGTAARDNHLGVAATGAGKSLVLYLLVKYYTNQDKKVLVLVPTIDLTTQLKDDFKDYNATEEFLENIQIIGGEFKSKDIKKNVVISTWQSAHKADLTGFDVVLNDECHLSKADVLLDILNNPFDIKLGLTGTPPLERLDYMRLEKNFGQPKVYINARGLIDKGLATNISIVPIFLQQKRVIMKYQDEVKAIKDDLKRRAWITKFMKKLNGMTIGLYQHTDHGKATWESLTGQKMTTKMLNNFEAQKELGVFFMSGTMRPKTRKAILEYFRTLTDETVIMIGQAKILSTGINIKPLKNLVFLSSSKSYSQVIQSIGRVLRLHDDKPKAFVFDLVDDFSAGRKTENFSLRHFWERLSFYEYQEFDVIEKTVQL